MSQFKKYSRNNNVCDGPRLTDSMTTATKTTFKSVQNISMTITLMNGALYVNEFEGLTPHIHISNNHC